MPLNRYTRKEEGLKINIVIIHLKKCVRRTHNKLTLKKYSKETSNERDKYL